MPLLTVRRDGPGRTSRVTPRAAPAAVIVVAWTLVGIATAPQGYLRWRLDGYPSGPFSFLAISLADAWTWAALTPLVLAVAARFPVVAGARLRRLGVHLVAANVVALLAATVAYALAPFLCGCLRPYFSRLLLSVLFPYQVQYALVVLAAHAWRTGAALRAQQLATAQLEGEAARLAAEVALARTAALTGQLRPHFLFNTLNAIGAAIHDAPTTADRMVTALGALLRRSLAAGDAPELPLREEVALVHDYLVIMRARLEERLRVTVDVAADVEDCLVPALLLQPLVENAIRHGLEPRREGGAVTIVARCDGGVLELRVHDDGVGLADAVLPGAASSPGFGLHATRERLRLLHGDAASLVLRAASPAGAEAVVRLPCRRART